MTNPNKQISRWERPSFMFRLVAFSAAGTSGLHGGFLFVSMHKHEWINSISHGANVCVMMLMFYVFLVCSDYWKREGR